MPHQVYRFPSSARARLDEALGDDILSRQSLTIRDARHFGVPGDWIFLFVEGEEKGIFRADAVLLEIGERAPEGPVLYQMLKDEEDAAASSLGSVLGEL
ncbi:MAG TPA: hypothetical protein VFH78_04420 [Candidatus Thermoplasmatota archaeon]|nr:hypothetical protein [Candidatus Thermoplasmatota archaeon]